MGRDDDSSTNALIVHCNTTMSTVHTAGSHSGLQSLESFQPLRLSWVYVKAVLLVFKPTRPACSQCTARFARLQPVITSCLKIGHHKHTALHLVVDYCLSFSLHNTNQTMVSTIDAIVFGIGMNGERILLALLSLIQKARDLQRLWDWSGTVWSSIEAFG